MKLIRFERNGQPIPGMVCGDKVYPIPDFLPQFNTMMSIIEGGAHALNLIQDMANTHHTDTYLSDIVLLAPLERPGKYMAIGMNYKKHEEEADKLGVSRRAYQTWFNKQTTCIAGPYDEIESGVTEKLDYEVELALVMGKNAKCVSEKDALDYVFGYMVANDVSARDWQFHTPTFTMGKSFDTHGPIGPWIVTADEINDPQNLDLTCYVNDEVRQSNNTSQMIHSVAAQISYLSQAFTLEAGDIIATGTPEGVGVAMEPPVFLKPGDVVRCEVQDIGTIINKVASI